jgi:hypothetical protein
MWPWFNPQAGYYHRLWTRMCSWPWLSRTRLYLWKSKVSDLKKIQFWWLFCKKFNTELLHAVSVCRIYLMTNCFFIFPIYIFFRCILRPDPCDPSPCGPGTMCMVNRARNPICRCLDRLIPKPDTITGCGPECTVSETSQFCDRICQDLEITGSGDLRTWGSQDLGISGSGDLRSGDLWWISGSGTETRNTRPPVSNLIMWQFEKPNVPPKLFFLTLLWEFVMFFQLSTSFHYSTAKQIPWGRINKTSRSF